MKSLILSLGLLFLSSVVFAAPFVVTDEHNKDLVENYVVTVDGLFEQTVTPTEISDGVVVGVYDVGGLENGEHTVTFKTVNMWGVTDPVPFSFIVRLPPTISSIQLVKEAPISIQ